MGTVNLTDNELSAAVAVARGEVVLKQTTFKRLPNGLVYWPVDKDLHPSLIETDGTVSEIGEGSYRYVKDYANDLNHTWELMEEMADYVDIGPVLNILHSGKERRYSICEDSTHEPESTPCRAISMAYLEWKNAQG